jgi:hypothetical protein
MSEAIKVVRVGAVGAAAAQASAGQAAVALATFRGIFYGALAADPALDPNGNAMTAGDLYFHTGTSKLRIYTGADWSPYDAASQQAASDAATALASFRSIFYGALAVDPALDPNGNAMTAGDLYFHTGTSKLRIYTGAAWVAYDAAAQQAVGDAATLLASFRSIFYGALAADPALDPNGNAMTAGDLYFHTGTAKLRIYNGAAWVAYDAAAQQAASEAAAALASFRSIFYGALAADPLVDPNGNAMTAGDLYFHTGTSKLRVFDGGAWVAYDATAQQAAIDATAAKEQALQFLQLAQAAASQGAAYLNQLFVQFASATALTAAMAAAQAAAMSAGGQVAAAKAYADQALSVVQQDLSGPTSARLHCSPNAITALFPYDTSQDSDGGRWIERMGEKSWMAEALNGVWLGAQASELNARSVGATLGTELADLSTGWVPSGGVTTSYDAATGVMAVTVNAIDQGITKSITGLVAGKLYRIRVGTTKGTITAPRMSVLSAVLPEVTVESDGSVYATFVATATSHGFTIRTAGTATSYSGTFFVNSISIKEVTAFTTASGAYYQLATDGKFYRLSRNLLKNSAWAGASGALGNYPTGWAVLGASQSACQTVQESVNGVATGVTKVRRLTNTITLEGIQQSGLATSLWPTAFGTSILVRVPTGVTASDLVAYDATSTVIASAATLNAQPKDVWVAYSVTHTPNAVRTAFCFGSPSGAIGTGFDLAMPSLEIGAVTTYDATTATQETFRGNKSKFPRMAGIVAEANSVTIYDLAEPGRPMWMRFQGGTAIGALIRSSGAISSVFMQGGELLIGIANAAGDLHRAHFIKDSGKSQGSGTQFFNGNIAQRNMGMGHTFQNVDSLASRFVNAVAMMVRPTAPVDPVTGLPVPTIGVAVGTGNAGQVGTVLMDDGTAVNYGQAGNDGSSVAFTKRGEVSWGFSVASSLAVMPLAAANVATISAAAGVRLYANVTPPVTGNFNVKRSVPAGSALATFGANSNRVTVLRENPSTRQRDWAATSPEPTTPAG